MIDRVARTRRSSHDVHGDWTRIAVGAPVAGWLRYDDSYELLRDLRRPRSRRRPTRRCCSTSPAGRPRGRSWSSTPTRPTPSGTCPRRTGSACSPATCTSTSPRPGWAKHAWSNVFAPWIAGATAFVVNQPRFDAARAARHHGALRRDDVLRTADGVADARAGGPARRTRCRRCARWSAPASRSTPRSSSRCSEAWGLTVRDGYGQTETTAQIGNPPGAPLKLGSMGRPLPGYTVVLRRPGDLRGRRPRARSASTSSARPTALMVGYRDDDELHRRGDARRLLPHRRRREPGRGRLHHLRRAQRRRVQGQRLPDLARSSWRAC